MDRAVVYYFMVKLIWFTRIEWTSGPLFFITYYGMQSRLSGAAVFVTVSRLMQ